ncbi:type I restriction enzyme, S subunit [Ruminococcus sp. YE71]|uniref:restriction endonuclease subunit S n=1 Tax=unclassified Ruminococcus TaxID=2608920 RepID=UPI00088C946D|nr:MULTISPECIES: restriction endonuclease subunit S [unclassified Ruminococcus]SDA24412.1 type I restriction enzyme, S subunit [Ruminococcus sp. YE78]SFW41980.1 type I restriction enzyme, S subunit [Ruminococcus sp. YE71]
MREMKDSGVAWIGEIPETWSINKMKYIGTYINGYAFKPDDWGNTGLPIIRIQDLTGSNNNPNYFNGNIDQKYYVKNGDILVSWAATLDAFEWNKGEGWLNQHIFKAIPQKDIVSKPYYIWLLKVAMSYMNDDNKHGIMMQHITLPVFNNFSIAIPPLEDQQKIAAHLDRKCTQIDALISNAQQQIEKLKAYKQSVITETVTKGLDPDVAMKDSGYDFIGMIPASWEICKLRHIGTPQNGISKGGEFFGTGFPFVSYGDIYKNFTLPEAVDGLVNTTETERKQYSVERGDIFFTRTSETIEEVGFSCVCEKTIPDATFAGFVIRVRPFNDKLLTGFAKYYFRSSHHRFYLVKEMNLVTRASLSQGLLKSMPVLVPTKEEQQEISDYLDHKCSQIDKLIALKQQKIEKLQQYKKSLIYEYVTGKKGV